MIKETLVTAGLIVFARKTDLQRLVSAGDPGQRICQRLRGDLFRRAFGDLLLYRIHTGSDEPSNRRMKPLKALGSMSFA